MDEISLISRISLYILLAFVAFLTGLGIFVWTAMNAGLFQPFQL